MVNAEASPPLAMIDSWPINIADEQQAIDAIVSAAERQESFVVFTLNLDHLDKLRRDSRFRDAYARARFVTADGAPVALLAARQDKRIRRTAGADLVVPLARSAARHRLPVYLFGTSPDVLSGASAYLRQAAGTGLDIVGSASPERDFDPEGAAADAALDRIAASGARLCFVALGAPKQEIFAARAVARGVNAGFICIGAGLDFLVGAQVRAPSVMQKYGMEWIWRLSTNPRRLGLRYARCAIVLAEIAIIAPVKERIARIRP